ncbi:MAG: EVE domain-containing protein [Phycisphaerales bacterium]
MATFLFKTEPGTFSYADLVKAKRATWDGVSNPGALAALRSVRKGDDVMIYHTGDEKAIVGLARAAGDAYADPKQPGTTAAGEIKFAVVDVVPVRAAKTPAMLAAIKADARFNDFALVRQARLSVMLVPANLAAALCKLAGL